VRATRRIPAGLPKLILPLAALAAGCSAAATERPVPPTAERNLHFLGLIYHQVSSRNGHAPASTEELKPMLRRFGYPEGILVSPNDGQPYTFCWGVQVFQPRAAGAYPVLAYESTGVGGRKYVVDAMLVVKQMSDDELQQALRVK